MLILTCLHEAHPPPLPLRSPLRNTSSYSAAAALLATGCSAADETSTENTAATVADASPETVTSTTGTAGSARSGKGAAAADERRGKTQERPLEARPAGKPPKDRLRDSTR